MSAAIIARQMPPALARRRLAPNVICMHDDERPPVINPPRRGRLPRSVVMLRSRQRIALHDVAEFIDGVNIGRKVRVMSEPWWDRLEKIWMCDIVPISGTIVSALSGREQAWALVAPVDRLRLIRRPARSTR